MTLPNTSPEFCPGLKFPRSQEAIAAFKLAVEWMATYAGWATSGGEGAALSYERDQFRALGDAAA